MFQEIKLLDKGHLADCNTISLTQIIKQKIFIEIIFYLNLSLTVVVNSSTSRLFLE